MDDKKQNKSGPETSAVIKLQKTVTILAGLHHVQLVLEQGRIKDLLDVVNKIRAGGYQANELPYVRGAFVDATSFMEDDNKGDAAWIDATQPLIILVAAEGSDKQVGPSRRSSIFVPTGKIPPHQQGRPM